MARSVKVAHILRKYNPSEWGGTETALQRLFDGFREHQISSVVFSPRLETAPPLDPFTDLGCTVRRFNACVPILGASRDFKQQLVSVGGNLMSFELIGSLWRESDLSIIHTHTLGRLGGIAMTVSKLKKVPLVVTIHGGVLDLPPALKASMNAPSKNGLEWGRVFGALFRSHKILQEADAVLTCNENEAKLMREKHPHQRVVVQPHGIRIRNYEVDCREKALSAYPFLKQKQVLFSLGRVDSVKNQAWLVEHLGPMFQEFPDLVLVLVGACTDEAYGEALKKKIEELGYQDKVFWLGGLPPQDPKIIGLLQISTMLVLPSVSETFGLVLLEGWAAGTAVMSSKTSGATGMIRENENGWLFDLQSPRTFHDALRDSLRNPRKRLEFAAAGKKLCLEYDLKTIAGRVKGLYEELIEAKHATRHHSRR